MDIEGHTERDMEIEQFFHSFSLCRATKPGVENSGSAISVLGSVLFSHLEHFAHYLIWCALAVPCDPVRWWTLYYVYMHLCMYVYRHVVAHVSILLSLNNAPVDS